MFCYQLYQRHISSLNSSYRTFPSFTKCSGPEARSTRVQPETKNDPRLHLYNSSSFCWSLATVSQQFHDGHCKRFSDCDFLLHVFTSKLPVDIFCPLLPQLSNAMQSSSFHITTVSNANWIRTVSVLTTRPDSWRPQRYIHVLSCCTGVLLSINPHFYAFFSLFISTDAVLFVCRGLM